MNNFWLKVPFLYDLMQVCLTGGFLSKVISEVQIPKGKKILELGCGTGTLSKELNCHTYVGVDLNPNFIEFAKTKFPQYSFKVLDIVTQRLPKEKFDYIVIMNVLHHLKDKEVNQLFKKIKKLTKARKMIIIEGKPVGLLAPVLKKLDDGNNFRDFRHLEKIISAYFKIKRTNQISSGNGIYKYLVSQSVIHE